MKYKLSWGNHRDDIKTKEFQKYSFSLQEDIDKLIELGYVYFELEIIEVDIQDEATRKTVTTPSGHPDSDSKEEASEGCKDMFDLTKDRRVRCGDILADNSLALCPKCKGEPTNEEHIKDHLVNVKYKGVKGEKS